MIKTIIEIMCSISEKMRPSPHTTTMPIGNKNKAWTDILDLCNILDMTPEQVLILTAIVQKSSRYRIDCEDIASLLDMEYLKFLTYNKEMEGLRKRGYIRIDQDGNIILPKDVLNNLKNNKPIWPEPMEGLDAGTLVSRIRKILGILEDHQYTTDEATDEIEELLELNPSNSLSRSCGKMRRMPLQERLLVYILIHKYYNENDDMIGARDVEDYYPEDEFDYIRSAVRREHTDLQKEKIIEFTDDDGLLSKDFIHLTDPVKEEIFADLGGIPKKEKKVSASMKIEAGAIARKELFYNAPEERQIGQLRDLMSGERFDDICAKMKVRNLRTGFTCLFYGAPGTGKTETVYQIARECGRDLFIVDVSQIKSCWVGECEKNIKAVFSKYRECVRSGGTVPILLFNEADAVFGIRSEGAGTAVEKMENSIQNIILQEMEDLEGILIATTNLTCNLDKAFERRFLYKIRFDKPCIEARARIWEMMLPELSKAESVQLATDYDFSGGQIENISRKRTIKALISGEEPSYVQIREYCDEETIGKDSNRRRIGY